VTATELQVAHAAEAVQLGMAVAEATMAAAADAPGKGFQVALPAPASGAATGEGYNLPDSTPALRPVAHVSAQPTYGSPLVGGQSFGGAVGFQTAREGVPMPAYRSSPSPATPGVVFVSASSPRAPLLHRIRDALGVLLGRR
jgi:hypothetical protein